MDFNDIFKLIDAGFTKDDILKLANSNLLGGSKDPKPKEDPKPQEDPKPKEDPKPQEDPKPSGIEEKLDKLIQLTIANNFGAENPFNPNASEKAANDFFANIIDPNPEREV